MTRIFGCNQIWEMSSRKSLQSVNIVRKIVQMHYIMTELLNETVTNQKTNRYVTM